MCVELITSVLLYEIQASNMNIAKGCIETFFNVEYHAKKPDKRK